MLCVMVLLTNNTARQSILNSLFQQQYSEDFLFLFCLFVCDLVTFKFGFINKVLIFQAYLKTLNAFHTTWQSQFLNIIDQQS